MDTNRTKKLIQIKSLDGIEAKGVEQELNLEETSLIIGGEFIAGESGQDIEIPLSARDLFKEFEEKTGIKIPSPYDKPFLKIL